MNSTEINEYNQFKNLLKNKFIFWGGIASIALVAVIVIYFQFFAKAKLSYLSSLSTEKQVAIGQLIGDAYRNIYGYQKVCQQDGISLKVYPNEFKKNMAEELEKVNQFLAKDNLTVESAFQLFVPADTIKSILQTLHNELKLLSQDESGSIKKACELLDEDASDIVQSITSETKPFYRNVLELLSK